MYRAGISLAALLMFGSVSYATTVVFNGFGDTTGLTISGNAATAVTSDGTVLRLTTAAEGESGSGFGTKTINAADFSTNFTYRITDPGGVPDVNGHVGADGITLAIQPISASIGGTGQGLGIGGISPSVAVEFDTWDDNFAPANDPSSNHIGVDVNGDVDSVITQNISPFMDDGGLWYAWVDYNGTTLTVSTNETGIRPATPDLSYNINIPSIIGTNDAYVGFTAATGGSYQNQDILGWTYYDHYVAPPTPGAVPLPPAAWSALSMLGVIGMVGAVRARKQRA